MTCSKCVAVLHEIDKFCDRCGTVTAIFEKSGKVSGFLCLHCGSPLRRTKRYCSACGELAQRKHRRGLLGRVGRWVDSPKAQLALALGLFVMLITPLLYLLYMPARPNTGKPPKVSSAYTIHTVVNPGEEGSRNQLRLPAGVAMDQQGNLYIADAERHRILKMDTAGVVFPYAGTGEPGFAGDKGPAYAARFLHPTGLATDLADYQRQSPDPEDLARWQDHYDSRQRRSGRRQRRVRGRWNHCHFGEAQQPQRHLYGSVRQYLHHRRRQPALAKTQAARGTCRFHSSLNAFWKSSRRLARRRLAHPGRNAGSCCSAPSRDPFQDQFSPGGR